MMRSVLRLVAFRCVFFLQTGVHTESTLFPYTTLFRSRATARGGITKMLQYLELNIFGSFANAPSSSKMEEKIITYLRSEEHTSELQSHSDLVCRLLLEKKK